MHPAWAVLVFAPMHATFFGLKRAWHGSLRVTRGALVAMCLTAARFDLLYALDRPLGLGCTQSDLRRTLGVSRATVSRMLGSLEDTGLVTRERSYADRRQRLVRLTVRGLSRIRRAVRRLIRTGAAQLVVETALAGELWHDDTACLLETDLFESFLRRIRNAFGDFASLYYPWHPDD